MLFLLLNYIKNYVARAYTIILYIKKKLFLYDEFIQKLTQNSNINFSKNKTNMKQKFYSILLTALMGLFGMNAWAQDLNITTIDGKEYYEIGSADDLVAFAQLVNGGDYTANAVLIANIDMTGKTWSNSIGDWQSSHMYKGKFDGQGHSITNLTITTARDYHGLFGVVGQNAEIKNFYIDGAVTVNHNSIGVVSYTRDDNVLISNIHSNLNFSGGSGKRVGGIVGNANQASNVGTATIDRCTYSGTMTMTGTGNKGGIVGYVLNNANVKTTISNCLFDGTITNDGNAETGGIVGYAGANLTKTVIKNCLSIGTINATVCGQFFGVVKNAQCSIINSYYQGSAVNGTALDNTSVNPTVNEATKVTDAQLASGEIAFKLNGDQSDINWFQKLKNTVFIAQQYVATVNGTPRDPQTANATMTEDGNGTYTFLLPDFVVHTNSMDIPAGDVKLEEVEITDEGTFNKAGLFSVPDENIPASMAALKPYLQNINYILSGKVNGDKLYATITDLSIEIPMLGTYNISVEIGEDNFTAAAPTGEAFPKPYGTAIVYGNGSFNCDMTPKAGTDIVYSNTNAAIIDPHSFTDGFCTVCGAIDETYMAANADGYFEIANEKQLVWFAAYVNEVNAAAKGTLTDNIALTKAWTNPIGNASVAYTGKFDGQGKAITGFDQTATTTHNGLFGNINGATVQNFSISGSLTSDKNYCGVIGLSKGSSKVKGIHSSLNLDIQFKGWAGGVVGGADGYIVIEECSFDGTLNTHNFDDSKGGILGYANGATIKNCLFSGTIVGEAKQHYGGILGYVNNNAFGGVQNCLSIGSVTTTNTSHNGVAAIIGNMNSSTKVDGIFNNYWLTGSSYAGNNGAKASDAEAPFEVTAEQLASGEVAYKLGAAWSQLLGTDNTPVLGTDAPVSYVGDASYATLYDTTTGYTLNGDVKAFVAVLNTSWLDLNEIDNIPEGTPVILKGSYYNKLAADLPAINVANDLKGTDADTVADGTMYILANGSNGVGFYQATTGSTIAAGKAYYQSTSGVKAFFFDGDDATGIADLKDLKDSKDLIYNLAGQRLGKMQRGINIVGGKKVLR